MAEKKTNKEGMWVIGWYEVDGKRHDVIGSYEFEDGRTMITLIDVDGPLHHNNNEGGRKHQTFIQVFNLRKQGLNFVGKYSHGSEMSWPATGHIKYKDGEKLIYLLMEKRPYFLNVVKKSETGGDYAEDISRILLKLLPQLLALKNFDVVPRKIMDAFREMAINSEDSLRKLGVIES